MTIYSDTLEKLSSTKFLGVHITEDQFWTDNTTLLAKKAQRCLYFLSEQRGRVSPPIMLSFYWGTIESVLTGCITVWYEGCAASCQRSLQHNKNTGAPPPSQNNQHHW